ncbi:2'-5' RNA ligase family protein [Solicola sp. PLA-1-18]|uniref:2'-5' RNA ligase family protein n=1 Tax=Solicola sp. PLA-1-18 TaxID=3380532 RepID=UPI003B79D55B
MVQSVELLLDAGTESALRAQWDALGAAGLPTQASHTGASNRPHVTLEARDSLAADAESALPDVAAMLPVPVVVGPPTVFGRSGTRSGLILVRSLVVDAGLLAVHDAVGPGGSPTSAPGRWMPHVTLARRMTADDVASALGVLDAAPDLHGEAVVLRRWDGEAKRDWAVGG